MKNFLLSTASPHSRDHMSMRFPHPFAYHFEKYFSSGVTTGAKYFRGHRVQRKVEVVCGIIKVETSSDKIE